VDQGEGPKKASLKKNLQNKARRTIMYVALKLWVRPGRSSSYGAGPRVYTPSGTSFASAIAGCYSRLGALKETEFLGLRNSRSSCTYRGWELGVVTHWAEEKFGLIHDQHMNLASDGGCCSALACEHKHQCSVW
jgi:hypothetical protein